MTSYYLDTALRLPAPDVEALIQGRSIAVMPRSFLDVGKVFALCPTDVSNNLLPVEQQYRSNFLAVAKNTISQLHPEGVIIKAWARCELCQILDNSESLEVLSALTIWTTEALQQILAKRPYIFLAYLRVYLLPEPLVMSADSQGQFVSLPKSISVSDNSPILSDAVFSQRRHQLENRLPPLHPELEELQSAIAQLAINNPAAKLLDAELKIFLDWSEDSRVSQPDPDLSWIQTIADVGNSSDGNAFEKLVRKSLVKLGFSCSNTNPKANLDPEKLGGAGGVDFYAEQPYPLVGECKATKTEKVPSKTPGQLIQLGKNHLQEKYEPCLKLVVAAGELTGDASLTAMNNQISVIRPEILQNLVEMQTKYPGSINLIRLKKCLQNAYGLADEKVEQYLSEVRKELEVRSHIVELVKRYLENTRFERAGVDSLHGAYCFGSNAPQPLQPEEMHEILVELSSPLTGYLGRIKGSHWRSDRFYYLRDLIIENI